MTLSCDKIGHVTCERHIDMPIQNEIDALLSPDELRVITLWRNGETMTDAYKHVMISPQEAKIISKSALQKRVVRFFATHRMREAMAASDGERGERARADYERWKTSQKIEAIKTFSKTQHERKQNAPECADSSSCNTNHSQNDIAQIDARKAWIDSLQVTDNPTAMSIFGTGLFLAQSAIQQILKRKKEIEDNGISCLDKDGSPYTALDLNALRTAASMILPFAPPPTTAERRAMSLASVMIGLTQDAIAEDPDAYTAPPPVIDTKRDEKK